MAFPVPNRTNQTRNALNTPARQRLANARQRIATMRGQMFPAQNPGLQPPQPPAPPVPQPAPQVAPRTAAQPQKPVTTQPVGQPQVAPQPTFSGRPIPDRTQPGMVESAPPPAPVGPGQITDQDIDNAPYMTEEALRTNAAETRRLQQQLAAINQQRQALGIGYGLGEFGGDAETNPYSRATLLQRGYERNQRASLNSMAASGQLYAGSLSNARNFNRFNYDVGYDSMRKQYDAALARLNQQELDAQSRYDDEMEAAMREAVSDGQELEEPTPEEVPEGQPQDGNQGGGAGARPRKKKVIGASKKRITKARGRINKLRKARSRAKNPKQRQRITKRIQNNKQTIRNNQKRISNVRQGKPQGQGIKPRPKPKKGKK